MKSIPVPIQVLTDEDIIKIYQASIEVLGETGVMFEDTALAKEMRERGCYLSE